MDIYEEVVRLKKEGRRCALVTVIAVQNSEMPIEPAKMVVREDSSTFGSLNIGSVESAIITAALTVIAEEKPQVATFNVPRGDDITSQGSFEVFIEPVVSAPTLYVFGAGQTGLKTYEVARLAGFEVVVIDFRAEFANRERFPEARDVIADDLPTAMSKVRPSSTSFIFIVTPSHVTDTHVLRWAIGTPAQYIGMIGSRSKVAAMFQELKISGVDSAEFERIHAPVGLDINAETPGEIAVAVVAEMISRRRNAGATVPHLRNRQGTA